MFRVGQKVVCIDDDWGFFMGEKGPIKGEIYTIRDIIVDKGETYLRFKEIVNPVRKYSNAITECDFWSVQFRPVTYISDSEFEELEKELNKEEYAKI